MPLFSPFGKEKTQERTEGIATLVGLTMCERLWDSFVAASTARSSGRPRLVHLGLSRCVWIRGRCGIGVIVYLDSSNGYCTRAEAVAVKNSSSPSPFVLRSAVGCCNTTVGDDDETLLMPHQHQMKRADCISCTSSHGEGDQVILLAVIICDDEQMTPAATATQSDNKRPTTTRRGLAIHI